MIKKKIELSGVVIGEGKPKLCIPLVGRTREQLLAEAKYIAQLPRDLVEWRVDFFDRWRDLEQVENLLAQLHGILQVPIIFTFRTLEEGGESIYPGEYEELLLRAAASPYAPVIDVEIYYQEDVVKRLIDGIHRAGKYVIASNHDFHSTPTVEELIRRMCYMQDMDADILKIAAMPRSRGDVFTLLYATYEMSEHYSNVPIVTMSMSVDGVVSRLIGEVTGSAITFGAAKEASAPGQIAAGTLHHLLEELHSVFHP